MADTQPKRNPALRLLGLPALPRKLPSRNWLIFWGVTTTFAAAIIYDKREKKRATARWVAAVAPLSTELLPNPSAMPRRITVYLEAPPGDGLRVAQDHFVEYAKPVLASSGLDWEFVVGRQQGDVRAVVAERIRRARRKVERDFAGSDAAGVGEDEATDEDITENIRRRNGIAPYEGVKGDLIVGRHTWKEYVRGLHEGWLGPLTLPAAAEAAAPSAPTTPTPAEEPALVSPSDNTDPLTDSAVTPPDTAQQADADTGSNSTAPKPPAEEAKPEDKEEEEAKPKRPKQIPPYNSPADYPTNPLPRFVPAELGPSVALPFPHLLGFLNTPTRLGRFLTRRRLADQIGRDVAAVCFAAAREYRETPEGRYEQEAVLAHEERDWPKTVWAEGPEKKADGKEGESTTTTTTPSPPKERIWPAPVVIDPRIGDRMRRFELMPEDEAAARAIVVPEEQIEGWTKGKFRQLGRWAARKWSGADKFRVNVGNLDDVD